MKYFLMLLFLIPLASFGQYEGAYCLSGGWINNCVTILPDHKFHFDYNDCTRSLTGDGWYEIGPTKLKLHFEKDTISQEIDTGKVEIETLKPQNKDTCAIELFILSKSDTQPLYSSSIKIEEMNMGTMADGKGQAILRIPRLSENVTLKIFYVGDRTVRMPVDLANDYNMKVILVERSQFIVLKAGKVYTLKICHKTKMGFDLVPNRKQERYSKKLG